MHKSRFSTFSYYLLRTPILPQNITDLLLAQTDKSTLQKIILCLYNDATIKEALLLSSPDLYRSIEKQLTKNEGINEKSSKSLFQYLIRMSSRCTPYGLLAGINIGQIKESFNSEIILNKKTDHLPIYRLDMQQLIAITKIISDDPHIRMHLKYTCNNTIYRQGSAYKFYKQSPTNFDTQTNLCSTPATMVMEQLLTKSQHPVTFSELTEQLCNNGAPHEKACVFIHKMIDNKLLIDDLTPALTGLDYLDQLISKLDTIDHNKRYRPILQEVSSYLKRDISLIERQQKISTLLQPVFPTVQSNNLLQGDLSIQVQKNILSETVINPIIAQLNELTPLAVSTERTQLTAFKDLFTKRYEDRMVPLLEALDPDTGLGYGHDPNMYFTTNQIFKGLNLESVSAPIHRSSAHFYDEFVLDKYLDAIQKNAMEIELEESDIGRIAGHKKTPSNLPVSSYVVGNLLVDPLECDKLRFHLSGFGGVSSTNLISRFGHLDDKLDSLLYEIAHFEQHCEPDSIYAEIIHLPDARTGNILQRPAFRKAEIPIDGQSTTDKICLKLKDLYLYIQNDKLKLWSLSHRKEVKPRLSTAHNYQQGIHLYRFLADLQFQDIHAQIKWSWGIYSNRPFLPRVKYKDIILSRAQWILKQTKHINVEYIKNEYKLPQKILLIEGDKELPLNLCCPTGISILTDKLAKGNVILHENLYDYFKSPVQDVTGCTYSNEIIIPLRRDEVSNQTATSPLLPNKKRSFPLGSEWVYVQIFSGPQSIDNLLQRPVPDLIRQLNNRSLIKNWFFVRYDIPQHHLRLRFEENTRQDYAAIVDLIYESFHPLLTQGIINSITFDTYVREIERYTPEYMEDSEALFTTDSNHILQLIQQYPHSPDRWLPALKNIDSMLDHAGYSLSKKTTFCQRMQTAFAKEFGNNKNYDRHFDQLFRTKKQQIRSFIAREQVTLLDQNRNQIISQVTAASDDKQFSLLSSYIHMHINRLFASQPRIHEYATYHLLHNYYRMLAGMQKQTFTNIKRSSTVILSPCDYTTVRDIVAL